MDAQFVDDSAPEQSGLGRHPEHMRRLNSFLASNQLTTSNRTLRQRYTSPRRLYTDTHSLDSASSYNSSHYDGHEGQDVDRDARDDIDEATGSEVSQISES